MNEYFRENKRSLLLLTSLLFILAMVLYVILLRPLLADLTGKKNDIVEKKDEIYLLEKQFENFELELTEIDVNQLEMEKKIPLERNLDEYILSIQQLEIMTGSKIEQIEFLYDSSVEDLDADQTEGEDTETTETEDNKEDEENIQSEDDVDTEKSDEQLTVDTQIITDKPDGLQVMTVKLVAASPNFDKFISLLETIENQERISIVSKLTINKPTETDLLFVEDPLKSIFFEAELTTFYYAE